MQRVEVFYKSVSVESTVDVDKHSILVIALYRQYKPSLLQCRPFLYKVQLVSVMRRFIA